MSKDGFENEDAIIEYINGKKISELNSNWQKFIKEAFGDIDLSHIVDCFKKAGTNKADIVIEIESKTRNISVKSGIGNSVHQEPIEEFIAFLKKTYQIDDALADDIRFFIWGDGTLDGKGRLKNRISAPKFNANYPDIIKRIKTFFKKHKRDLIGRFVISGSKSKSAPDYIYYGGKDRGIWKKTSDVLDWLCDDINESNGAIPVGRLTFQAWNRNINSGSKSEHKRGVIQLKWGSIGEDLKIIFGN